MPFSWDDMASSFSEEIIMTVKPVAHTPPPPPANKVEVKIQPKVQPAAKQEQESGGNHKVNIKA